MAKAILHKVFITVMVLVTILVTAYLSYTGYEYYNLPLEERFYHARHDWFKPSGEFGHGLGIVGTLMILFGVVIYIARKRYGFMSKYIRLKYLLEFHIFLCVLGPILIVFHTAFKFGGIVSVAFWSMLAVVASGVIGRFIYIQIPRTIEGRELSLNELRNMKDKISSVIAEGASIKENILSSILEKQRTMQVEYSGSYMMKYFYDKKSYRLVNSELKRNSVNRLERKKILKQIKEETTLANRISRLNTMQKLFKYWHVAHLPFALIMLIIVVLHVVVTLAFGYKWIF